MLFTSKRVIKKLPIKFNLINKLTNSKYFFYGILFLSILRLIKFYKENNVLCLGIFIAFILLFVNKKSLNIKINLGKRREIALLLLTCVCITTLLCHTNRLIEGYTGATAPITAPTTGSLTAPTTGSLTAPTTGSLTAPTTGETQENMLNQNLYQSNNMLYGQQEQTKCEETFQKENETTESLELGIDTCNLDIEKLQRKEKTAVGEMKIVIKDKIKILDELKIQLENKKKLLDGQIKKEKILEKKAYLLSPPDLMTGGNRPIPVEEYENPIVKEKREKYLESVTSSIEIAKLKHNKKIPKVAFEEKGKIISINEASTGASKY